ncbi:MAG: hypothetical protein ACRC10_07275 [Thermoguttaceae bacterium]
MYLAELDNDILSNCLLSKQRGWENFIDRFMGLVLHVIDDTATTQNRSFNEKEREMCCVAIFQSFRANNFLLLRNYQKGATLSSYLTIIARRSLIRLCGDQPTS